MSKFIFDNAHKYQHHINTNNDTSFNRHSQFTFDNGCLSSLMSNKRESYKQICERYKLNKPIFHIDNYDNDYIKLTNAFVNINGVIVAHDKERYMNGGCLCGNTNVNLFHRINRFDNVISISSMWANGIWHFPYEAFVALMSIPKDILDNSLIHVSGISNYILQWFDLINIPSNRIITGNVIAKNLYLPRMGKCGNPYYSQINWLKNVVNKHLPNDHNDFEYVVLIKRNNRRVLRNFAEFESVVRNFAQMSGLKLYIHDDNNLPTLKQQHAIFHNARFVFTPHGAGGVNLVAMRQNSWYIELLSNEDINVCYSRLAYFCNINYKGISFQNGSVDIHKIKNILNDLQSQT